MDAQWLTQRGNRLVGETSCGARVLGTDFFGPAETSSYHVPRGLDVGRTGASSPRRVLTPADQRAEFDIEPTVLSDSSASDPVPVVDDVVADSFAFGAGTDHMLDIDGVTTDVLQPKHVAVGGKVRA